MKRTRILFCACVFLGHSYAAEPTDPFAYKTMMRYPVVAVPTLRGPVNVDGDPTKVDWQFSTVLQDFVSLDLTDNNGFAAREQTTVWLSYNEHALHVGFKMQMQEGVAPKITIAEGHDKGFNDDAFEIFLTPDESSGAIYHLGGTAGGVWWDRRLILPKLEWEWNPAVTYRAKVDKERGFWSGEWVIPWEAFGRAAPKEGEMWRANFVSNRRAPEHRLDSWSYWRKWLDNGNDGRIIFGGARPSFAMHYPTAEAWKGRGVFPAVANPLGEKSPRQVQCAVDLYRKKQSGGNSFLKDLQTRRDRATGEGATFAPYEKDVDDTLADYELVQQQPDCFLR